MGRPNKVIIAGTRNLKISYETVSDLLRDAFKDLDISIDTPCIVLSGHSGRMDVLGEQYAYENWFPIIEYSPKWKEYGKVAGPIRNQEMVNKADALILIWDGKSRGSLDVLTKARKKRLIIKEVIIK